MNLIMDRSLCRFVPAPFWLFGLDETNGDAARARNFKDTDEARTKWKVSKGFYKRLQGFIKTEIKKNGKYLHRYKDGRFENQPLPMAVLPDKTPQPLLPPAYFRRDILLPPSYFDYPQGIPGGQEDRMLSPVDTFYQTEWDPWEKEYSDIDMFIDIWDNEPYNREELMRTNNYRTYTRF